MEVSLIFKIAAVGILVSVISQILKHSGREEHAFLTSLAGLILVLFWIVPYIYELFETIKNLFSKTQAGIRKVPINHKLLPFFEYWYNKNDCEYLISTPDSKHFTYRNYYDSYWKPLIEQLSMKHRPHDTRHTCVSLLAAAGIDERIIKKIVGHAGQGVTENVYTHYELESLREAINKI